MADACEVSIDLDLLRDHLSVAERKRFSIDDVAAFLESCGF
jgi:hypothetical protein